MIKWLKLIFLVILLSCKPKKGHITLGPGSLGAGYPNPVVISLQVTSDQLIINGSNLQGVTAVAMTTTTRAAYTKHFNVLSANINQVVAVAVDSIKIPINTALNLILSTAQAQSSVPIEFALPPDSVSTPEIEDGAVTAAKIEDNSITTSKIGNHQVTFNKLQPGPVSGGQSVITWNPSTQQYYLAASGGGGGTAGVSDITIGSGIVGQDPSNPPTVNGLVPIGVDIAVGGSPIDIKIPFFNNVNEIELNWGAPGISNKPAKILFGNGTSPTSHFSISNQTDIFTISWENPTVKKLFEIDAAGNVSALGGGGALQSVCLEDGTGCPTAPPTGVTQIITTAPLTGSGTGIVTIGPGLVNTANNLVQLDSFGNLPAALNIPTMSSSASGQFQPILSGGSDKTLISAPYSIPDTACTNGQILKANGSGDFICGTDAGGVISFNGRIGVVTPTAGDYTASEITNVPFPGPAGDISALDVQGALDELSTNKLAKAGGVMTGTITTTTPNAIQIGPFGEIRFVESIGGGVEYVGFKSSVIDLASPIIWTLPSAAGASGTMLATNGNNDLYWTTVSGGTGGIGDVVGPATSTSGNISIFADNNGKIIQDGGKAASLLVTMVPGPPGITPGDLPIFNSPDGTVIQNSGIFYAKVVQGPPGATPTSTNQAIPIWNGTSGNSLSDSAFIINGSVLSGGSGVGIAAIGTPAPNVDACFFNSNNPLTPAICQSGAGNTKITSNIGQEINFLVDTYTALALTATATVNFGTIVSKKQNAIQIDPYGAGATQTGEIRFEELNAAGINYVGFKAPSPIATDTIWTLPAAAGASGTVLATDASNNLYWTSISGGAGGIGDVVGPANSTNTNLASFNGATGKIIQDSGIPSLRVVQGPVSSTNTGIPIWNVTTGNSLSGSAFIINGNVLSGGTGTGIAAIGTGSTPTEACFYNNSFAAFPAICQSSAGKTKITSQTGQIVDFILGSYTGLSLTATSTVNFGTIVSKTQNAIQIDPFGAGATQTGEIRFEELTAAGINYVGFKAPSPIATDTIWTLPAAAGASGTVLSTDASNALYWKTITGGAGGIGDVVGPANSTNTNLASFNGITGKVIQDTGILAVRVVTGPGTAGIGNLASFSSIAGNAIQDTLIPALRIVQGATSTTNQAIPIWNGTTGNALSDSAFKIVGNILSGGTAPGIAAIGTSSTSTEACFFNNSSPGFPAICQSSVGKTKVTSPTGQIMDFIVGATTVLSVTATGTVDFGTITSNTNTANAIQINPFGVSAGNTGEIRFQELLANGPNFVALKGPSSASTNTIWTLPFADGTSGQALTTNGSGILSWGTPVSSTIDKAGGSTLVPSDCGNTVAITSGGSLTLTALPVGCVVNVIQKGGGVVTVTTGGGLTPQNAFGLYRTRTQYSVISIQVMDATTAVISGDVN